MTKQHLMVAAAVVLVSVGTLVAQQRPVDKLFTHYDHIAQALVNDSLGGVHDAAVALRPLALEIGGEAVTAPAAQLEAARSIEDIRTAFAALSEVLVPKFLDANLPGVVGFVCTMKKAQWVQRGTTVANPYYGTAMPTCGVPIKREG